MDGSLRRFARPRRRCLSSGQTPPTDIAARTRHLPHHLRKASDQRSDTGCVGGRRNAGFAPAVALALCLASPAHAIDPGERLADPALEARARAIAAELRCLVCQNQSIDDSNAPLARDLRQLVREQLTAGRSDAEIKRFAVERYGEFVLLRPPLGWHTLLLWLAPLLVLAGAGWLVRRHFGRSAPQAAMDADRPLTAEEQAKLDRLLGHSGDKGR
jgi:cytochrome c-type biogenesis protein CcmH